MAIILDGKAVSTNIRSQMTEEVSALKEKGIIPGLALIIVGKNYQAHNYVRNKHRGCVSVGVHSILHKLPAEASEQDLFTLIDRLNTDKTIHGIHIQQPLPDKFDILRAYSRILPEKDAAGTHPLNIGKAVCGLPGPKPYLAHSILMLLDAYKVPIKNKLCVIVSVSHNVMGPLTILMSERKANVILCNPETPNLKRYTEVADILFTGVGRPKYITAEMVKQGAVILDNGSGLNPEGTRLGDVDFDGVFEKVSYINPVPGFIGPMSVTVLLRNTIDNAMHTLPEEENTIDKL